MVTFEGLVDSIRGTVSHAVKGACLSTDTKPTNVGNGSILLEMDTGKTYAFNAEGGEWVEVPSSGGGGGGGGGGDFSTAIIDVTTTTGDAFYLNGSVEIFDDEMAPTEGFETGEYTLVLYKGEFAGQIQGPDEHTIANATGTGGVAVSNSPFGFIVTITGDGTLSVTV